LFCVLVWGVGVGGGGGGAHAIGLDAPGDAKSATVLSKPRFPTSTFAGNTLRIRNSICRFGDRTLEVAVSASVVVPIRSAGCVATKLSPMNLFRVDFHSSFPRCHLYVDTIHLLDRLETAPRASFFDLPSCCTPWIKGSVIGKTSVLITASIVGSRGLPTAKYCVQRGSSIPLLLWPGMDHAVIR